MRARKSSKRARAIAISRSGTWPVSFRNMCRRTIRFPGAPVEDAVERRAEVAAQLAKLALDLRAVRERQVRPARAEQVQSLDLLIEHRLGARIEALDEVIDRLAAVGGAVVDGLEAGVAHERLPLAAEVTLGRSLGRSTIAARLSTDNITGVPPSNKPALERGQLDSESLSTLMGVSAGNGAETCQRTLRCAPVAAVALEVSVRPIDVGAQLRPLAAAPHRRATEPPIKPRPAGLRLHGPGLSARHRRP